MRLRTAMKLYNTLPDEVGRDLIRVACLVEISLIDLESEWDRRPRRHDQIFFALFKVAAAQIAAFAKRIQHGVFQ